MKRFEVKVSSKGQLVIPKELRKKYKIRPTSTVVLQEEEGGIKILAPVNLADVCGSLQIDRKWAKKAIERDRSEW